MGTYCSIAIKNPDCTITSIVASSNGYVSYMADMLINHYQDRDKIKKVINCGNISHLVETVESYDDECFTEENTPARTHENFQEYCNWLNGFLLHNYLMDSDGRWLYIEREQDAVLLKRLVAEKKVSTKWMMTKHSFKSMFYAIETMFQEIGFQLDQLVRIWRR